LLVFFSSVVVAAPVAPPSPKDTAVCRQKEKPGQHEAVQLSWGGGRSRVGIRCR
jgi:hypothetical protein